MATCEPFDIKTVELPSLMAERMARSREFKKYGIKVYVGMEDFGSEDEISISINRIIETTKLESFQRVIATLETLHISLKLVEAQADTIKRLNEKNSALEAENDRLKCHLEICEKQIDSYIKMLSIKDEVENG